MVEHEQTVLSYQRRATPTHRVSISRLSPSRVRVEIVPKDSLFKLQIAPASQLAIYLLLLCVFEILNWKTTRDFGEEQVALIVVTLVGSLLSLINVSLHIIKRHKPLVLSTGSRTVYIHNPRTILLRHRYFLRSRIQRITLYTQPPPRLAPPQGIRIAIYIKHEWPRNIAENLIAEEAELLMAALGSSLDLKREGNQLRPKENQCPPPPANSH